MNVNLSPSKRRKQFVTGKHAFVEQTIQIKEENLKPKKKKKKLEE